MTAQTSDTEVTSLRMWQLALAHGLLTFAFNTSVVALGVNVVSSILQPRAYRHFPEWLQLRELIKLRYFPCH